MKAKGGGREAARRKKNADELEDDSEKQEPMLKAQIRKSSDEYRRGKKRDAGAFLAELRQKPASRKK